MKAALSGLIMSSKSNALFDLTLGITLEGIEQSSF